MAKFTNLDKAKAKLLSKSPFFATLLFGTPLIENPGIPTAATDGKRIMYNPEFIGSLSVGLVQFVLAHEIGHMIYEHVPRRQSRNPRLWNIAGDYVINGLLRDDGFEIWEHALVDKKYDGMSTEQAEAAIRSPSPWALYQANLYRAAGSANPGRMTGSRLSCSGEVNSRTRSCSLFLKNCTLSGG